MAERTEGIIDDGADRLRGVTAAPIGRAEPVADLWRALARFDTADPYQIATAGYGEGCFAILTVIAAMKRSASSTP